jgi:tetratricopeptide (TPR) repeat protein
MRIIVISIALLLALFAPSQTARAATDADICYEGKSRDAIIAACTRVIASRRYEGRDLAWAYLNRGMAYRQSGDPDRAILDYDLSVRLDPSNVKPFIARANAWDDKGNYDRAIADYDAAIRMVPDYPMIYTARGRSYEKKGDVDRARIDYKMALSLPAKYDNAQWAHDTARDRLAEFDAGK